MTKASFIIFTLFTLASISLQDNLQLGLTDHFKKWLKDNKLDTDFDFNRGELAGGSYGGKQSDTDVIKNIPLIFIHGNSDVAAGTNDTQIGFTQTIQYMLTNGYTQQELYATTWGKGNLSWLEVEVHNQQKVMLVRKFIEAVLAYTGSSKVNLVAHSMGVTLARRAIKGGKFDDGAETYDIGVALTDKIDTFISMSGSNYGIPDCANQAHYKLYCSYYNGYWAGPPESVFLKALNDDTTREAAHIFALSSLKDEFNFGTGDGSIDFGMKTGAFPTVDESHTFSTQQFSYLCMRDVTAPLIKHLIDSHTMKDFNFDSLFQQGIKCLWPSNY
ncbi:lipase [Stylonychia lemnae]|uniref:Lipase n=1 Tax=Stylonychia lemnae TaxID=5949 RepID=A0A078AXP4_STYLE|nr:lipase [Stylonychia lemnae]|eukprot:CDW85573.1 lipase [Stylonychia lemnae]